MIGYSELKVEGQIGCGSYGRVFKGEWLGQKVAIKVGEGVGEFVAIHEGAEGDALREGGGEHEPAETPERGAVHGDVDPPERVLPGDGVRACDAYARLVGKGSLMELIRR